MIFISAFTKACMNFRRNSTSVRQRYEYGLPDCNERLRQRMRQAKSQGTHFIKVNPAQIAGLKRS